MVRSLCTKRAFIRAAVLTRTIYMGDTKRRRASLLLLVSYLYKPLGPVPGRSNLKSLVC